MATIDPPRQTASGRLHFLLPGASLPDRLLACVGALVGIAVTGFVCGVAFGAGPHLPLLVAPMGASAVLLFAVPASPLAQPWSIVGGNTISALVGIAVARLVPDVTLAAGLAVGLAILAMSLTRCLHPPGGAAALTAVVGGPAVAAAGFGFAVVPVAVNSILLAAIGIAFHRLRRNNYPHKVVHAPAPRPSAIGPEDIDLALEDLGVSLDVERDDLERLIARAGDHARRRAG